MKCTWGRKSVFLVCLVACLFLFPAWAMAADLVISTEAQLRSFASSVNAGEDYAGKTVELSSSIKLTGEWTPIGSGIRASKSYTGNAFRGTFDGKGYTISGLKSGAGFEADSVFGLFGIVDGGTVKNLTLNGVEIDTDSQNVGAAVGLMVNGATVESITVSGRLEGKDGVGGVVGRMIISGTIRNCVNNATVDATGGGSGGIVAKAYYTQAGNEMNIENCTNTGAVSNQFAGGIAGLSAANIKNCVNKGLITAGEDGGGIAGQQTDYGEVSGNANNAKVTNGGTGGASFGGIIGKIRYQGGTSYERTETIQVTKNLNIGDVIATNSSGDSGGSGGIVGLIQGHAIVTENVNKAAKIVTGTGTAHKNYAGGIVGHYHDANDTKSVQIKNNVSTTPLDNMTGSERHLYAEESTNAGIDIESNGDVLGTQPVTLSIEPADATAVVKDVFGNVIQPEADGTYNLEDGLRYSVEVSLDGNTVQVPFAVEREAKNIKLDVSHLKVPDVANDVPAVIDMPDTGDNNRIMLWSALMVVSFVGVYLMRRKMEG